MAFKYEILGSNGRSCCKSNDIKMLCLRCQAKVQPSKASKPTQATTQAIANVSGSKTNKPAIKPSIRVSKPALQVASTSRPTLQRRKFLARHGVKLTTSAPKPESKPISIEKISNSNISVSVSGSNSNTGGNTMSTLGAISPNLTLNISADVHQQLRRQIDNAVTIRFAAYKARPLRKIADPFGTNAQLEAAKDSQVKAQIEEEEYQRIYGPIYAHAHKALVASGAITPKVKEMPDPLGLRAHGINPDGTPCLGDVDDSNPFQKSANERLNLDTGNPGKGRRD